MREQDKYYTPKLGEFHPGFEYEYQAEIDGEFKPKVHTVFTEKEKHDWINACTDPDIFAPTFYRVKWLDHDDFTGLGFQVLQPLTDKIGSVSMVFEKEVHHRGEKKDLLIIYNEFSKWMLVSVNGFYGTEWLDPDFKTRVNIRSGNTLFAGEIKNVSEFMKLLKQLKVA